MGFNYVVSIPVYKLNNTKDNEDVLNVYVRMYVHERDNISYYLRNGLLSTTTTSAL